MQKLADANRWQLAGVLVEDRVGLENLDEMLAIDGLDLVYLGVYDLSQALGFPGQVDHPTVLEAVSSGCEPHQRCRQGGGSGLARRRSI